MLTTIDLKKVGGLVRLVLTNSDNNTSRTLYEHPIHIQFEPLVNGKLNVSIGGDDNGLEANDLSSLSLADIFFNGQNASDMNDFETKLALVFPEATTIIEGDGSSFDLDLRIAQNGIFPLESVDTYADISDTTTKRYVYVIHDENYSGVGTMYFCTGSGLVFLKKITDNTFGL